MKRVGLILKAKGIGRRQAAFQIPLIFLFLFPSLLLLSSSSFGQCEMKFEYEVENSTPGKSDGKIYLKMMKGSGPVKFKLYDKYKGNPKGFDKETGFILVSLDERKLVFDNIPSSSYWIQVDNGNCKYTIGGLEGINVR